MAVFVPAPAFVLTAFAIIAFSLSAPAPAVAANLSCDGFMANIQKQVTGLAPQFVRPVIVSPGRIEPGSEVRDLITSLRIDGQLYCQGDRFVRFEARVQSPYDTALLNGFESIQVAAVTFAMGWPRARAARTLRAMHARADEYLRASIERGDAFYSGKVEEHAGAAGEIGVVWTPADRAFILVD